MRFAYSAPTTTMHAAVRTSPVIREGRLVPRARSDRSRCTFRATLGARQACRVLNELPAGPSGSVQQTTSHFEACTRRQLLLAAVSVPLLLSNIKEAVAASGISKVFVAGATGNTGRRVVYALRRSGYNVIAGVRDVKKAQSLGFGLDPSIQVVQADVLKGPEALALAMGDAQAVICATGYLGFNPNGYGQVDEVGTINLVNAAKQQGVKKFVLVSSLLTNAPALGQQDNGNYKFLNLFGKVLDHKLVAEQYLRSSGVDYTIIRPGGLSNEPESAVGNLIARKEDTLFGLDTDPGREISRDTVAEVAVQALKQPTASNKVVEVVASPNAQQTPPEQWFP